MNPNENRRCDYCARSATHRIAIYGTPIPRLWTCDEHAAQVEAEVAAGFEQWARANGITERPRPNTTN